MAGEVPSRVVNRLPGRFNEGTRPVSQGAGRRNRVDDTGRTARRPAAPALGS